MFVYGNNIVLFVTKLLPTWLWFISWAISVTVMNSIAQGSRSYIVKQAKTACLHGPMVWKVADPQGSNPQPFALKAMH